MLKVVVRRTVLLVLVALIVASLWYYRDLRSPGRAWRQAIHGPDRQAAWTHLQRDKEISGLDREGTIAEVFAAFDDPDPETRRFAVATITSLDPDPLRAIPHLAAKLSDTDPEVRVGAASALGDVVHRGGLGREDALRAIAAALKDTVPAVRSAAVASLGQWVYQGGESADPLRSGQSDDPALELAVDRLRDDDPTVRVESAYVLACNDRGVHAVPMLINYLKSRPKDRPPTRAADRAFLALMVLAIHSDEAAAFLGSMMAEAAGDEFDRPRDALAWVARQSGEARARVRHVAGTLIGPEDPTLRRNVGFLLHEIGSDQAAMPILIETLKDESVDMRLKAIQALADIGGEDPAVVPALETVLNDPDRVVSNRAAAALELIELEEILYEMERVP